MVEIFSLKPKNQYKNENLGYKNAYFFGKSEIVSIYGLKLLSSLESFAKLKTLS
ncbi:hypothetical protein J2Y60_003624 [Arcicella sp. BE140]|uniref:hypothetical protein n=1 Tax=Arcicella sp. BE140 TaxID=2817847 RepID=UPI00285B35FF|nr:hypothetical protein [Arcicella sp. BE140]MDR6563475.1 hypothetical protein [Arcicella sp. BE51]MDR6813413.1 hypothetical protein [Arcicella sp. BE140]MDR6824726.1 hypothetical protein [Arcicella sp. BE139]